MTNLAVTGSQQTLYKSVIGIFAIFFSLGSVCLVIILVRSRRTFSVRPFHSGICFYIASFAPYAPLKAVAVGELLAAEKQDDQLKAGLMINGTFMMFLRLGFGGKMALIQLWMHLISRHTSSDRVDRLFESACRTWRFMRLTVAVVCLMYSTGFVSHVGFYVQASRACSSEADSTVCIPLASSATPPACQKVVSIAQGIVYYEGLFAAVVAIVFTFYALMFNGLVYAMLTSYTIFSNLIKLQVCTFKFLTFKPNKSTYLLKLVPAAAPANCAPVSAMDATPVRARCRCYCNAHLTPNNRFIPPSWRPSKTSGNLNQCRTSLRALGIKLAVISVCSFKCKAVLLALHFFGVVPDGSSLDISMSTLLVEALPSLLAIALLTRYQSGSIGAARDSGFSVSLLTIEREAIPRSPSQ